MPRLHDAYAAWSQRNDLFLHPSPRCITDSTLIWDPIFYKGITRPIAKVKEVVPDEVGAFNILKNEFATARWLSWIATAPTALTTELNAASTHTRYLDTLDYGRYDLFAGLARQAFQSGNNLLDKIAAFICLYLEIHRTRPYFRGWWRKDPTSKSDLTIHPLVEEELGASPRNAGFWALTDLTADFEAGGRYWELQQLRHTATHRLLSQHEVGAPASSPLLVHVTWPCYKHLLLEQLSVAPPSFTLSKQSMPERLAIKAQVRLAHCRWTHGARLLAHDALLGRRGPCLERPKSADRRLDSL